MAQSLPPLPLSFSQAIARQEGWYVEDTAVNRSQRNNNPGDVEFSKFTELHGSSGSDGRFAIFPDAQTGFDCLIALLQTPEYFHGTIHDAIARYAPSSENNTEEYVENVCEWMNETPQTLVLQVRL